MRWRLPKIRSQDDRRRLEGIVAGDLGLVLPDGLITLLGAEESACSDFYANFAQ